MKVSIWNFLGAQDYSAQAKKKLGIVALLYLIQGAPAAILWEVLPVYFRLHGVSLRAIGGLRLLELPYSLKVFWSPLVHRYGDRRIWVLGCMLGIAAVLFALPFVNVAGVGLLTTAKNAEAAKTLIDYLLSAPAQQYFADKTYEYPLLAGIKTNELVVPLADIKVPNLDLSKLADREATLNLLRDTGVV